MCTAMAIVLLANGFSVDAAKSSLRRGGGKTKTHTPIAHADNVRLSYGSQAVQAQPHNVQQYPRQQQHPVQQSHANPPYPIHASAPEMPKAPAQANPHPIGWNPGHGDTAQRQTVSNTNANPPPYSPYPQNAGGHGPPPPYSANPAPNQGSAGFAPPPHNTHVAAPSPYTPNTGVNGYPGK